MTRARGYRFAAFALALLLPWAASAEPLLVFAAASLTEPLEKLEASWRQRAGAPALTFQFAASSALAVQIEEGAPADVVATADEPTMQRLAAKVEPPQRFARNRLVVAVEKGNPKGVRALADLARSDLIVVLAAPQVPAGRYAQQMLEQAGVRVAPRSLEENVKAVLQKVALGEADAGVVYASDVRASGGRVQAVEVPEAAGVEVTYWIAPLRAAKQAAEARAFAELVLSPAGRAALAEAGFAPP